MSKILIVDEQPLTREALRLLLENDRHEVVAEADNGFAALQQVRDFQPEIMILELSIPRLGGLEVIQRLAAQRVPIKTLVLTSQDSEYFAGRCLAAGATGFVSKQADSEEVLQAVRALIKGASYFPSSRLGTVNTAEQVRLDKLSVRELSVLQFLAKGMSNIAIADQLAISDKTVSTYKTRLMEKMQAKSLVELVDIARRHDLIEGESTKAEVAQIEFDEEQQKELSLLRHIIDGIPYPVSLRSLDTRVLFCNQAAVDFLGVPMEGIIGKRVGEMGEFLDPNEAELLKNNLVAAITEGEAFEIDVEVRLKQGRCVLRHWGKPYRDKNGRLIGAVCGSINITDQDDVVRSLRNTNARIEVISQGKTEYLRGIAEEIQGPLQNIIAMINLRLSQSESDPLNKPLLVARSVSSNLLRVLDDVQLLCRAKAGRVQLIKQEVDLRELVAQQLDAVSEKARSKGLELNSNFDLALQANVWCDSRCLEQIIQILLDNAISYTDEGSVLVRLSARGQGKGLVEMQLEVIDTGVGISESDQRNLFEPFSYDMDGTRIGQGRSSLGLALCKSLVSLMGGTISAESRLGVGTEIRVSLVVPDAAR
jgi:two-component system sensor histidine kinase EvgS/two-component system response regulator EvgA